MDKPLKMEQIPGYGDHPQVIAKGEGLPKKGIEGIPSVWPPEKGKRFELAYPAKSPRVLYSILQLTKVTGVTERKRGGYILTDVDGDKLTLTVKKT